MRALLLVCLVSLAGCAQEPRVEAFTATGPRSFLYAAQTNTVMPPNDDGTAERIRRYWIADAVMVNALCLQGYAIETRRFVPDPVGNGGAILYSGRCLDP
ncbi:MAG: hypothetical protein AB7H90_18825 [Alphaproteobacteria bacterium]